jgi:hypothetical protein
VGEDIIKIKILLKPHENKKKEISSIGRAFVLHTEG